MVLERPNRPNKPTRPQPYERTGPKPAASPQNHSPKSKPKPRPQGGGSNRPSGGGRNGGGRNSGGHGNGRGRNDRPEQPSPWLGRTPDPASEASFVEYLRWMRAANHSFKDATKVEILQKAAERGDYRDRLNTLTERTKLIAGENNWFEVNCPWRIRVGGHRGPESILLPAFDALGMPYIPSSTLRGVARNQGIREFMKADNLSWSEAEKKIAPYFGSLDANAGDRAGKVVFLDAYPLPNSPDNVGGLAVDMANNIWQWKDENLAYSPNPNPFFSLQKSSFIIGIRPGVSCNSERLDQVKQWLIDGLNSGVGSQINSGYGQLTAKGVKPSAGAFLRLKFSLKGQLIHGCQTFTQYNWNDRRQEWQMRGRAQPEVRSIAMKSMLRYWFRAFALGILPTGEVQDLEAKLFGSITPPTCGWITVNITDGTLVQKEARPSNQGRNDPCGEQSGVLLLKFSEQAPENQAKTLKTLLLNLTWMMFHLGGVGQGARRPCYSRKNRDRAPWWRGSTLYPDSEDPYWDIAETVQGFQQQFQRNLKMFYGALRDLSKKSNDPRAPRTIGQVRPDRWVQAVDSNCRIVVCDGDNNAEKPYGLAVLHHRDFKCTNRQGQADYDPNLCGQVRRPVNPSPVWVSDLGDYQVITVFGASQSPRKDFLEKLRTGTGRNQFAQIWPLKESQ